MRLTALATLVPDAEAFLEHPPLEPVVWRDAAPTVRFGLEEAGELVEHGSLSGPMVSQVRPVSARHRRATRGRGVPPSPGSATSSVRGGRRRTSAAGATTVLESLHRTWRPVGDLCRRLSFETGVPWSANAFLTPGAARASGTTTTPTRSHRPDLGQQDLAAAPARPRRPAGAPALRRR